LEILQGGILEQREVSDTGMSTLIVIVADTHINSTVGLCPPRVIKDDGDTRLASEGQRILWRNWLDFWDNIPKADRTIGIFNGDIVEGDTKKRSTQVISRNKATINRIAIDALKPALERLDACYFIRGTEAHTGKSGQLEELLAQDITTAVHDGENASWWYLERECEGVKIFACHHTSMGRLPWTFANAANRNAAEAEYYYSKLGKPPPDVIFYAHNHLFANSGRGNNPSQVFHIPAWQMGTSYTNKKPLSLSDIGGMTLLCDDGSYTWDLKRYKKNTTKIWKQTI
jgi:hypothetical protein